MIKKKMEIQAIKTLSTMLLDRGYKLDYVDLLNEKKESFVIQAMRRNNDGSMSNLFCFLCDDKLNIKVIKEKICFSKNKLSDCIIVYNDDITSSARKAVDSFDIQIELFSLKELQLNITLHRLVPYHEQASFNESEKLKSFKIPYLLSNDPIVRYYKFKKGSYVKITRKNGIVTYRQVKN